MCCWRLNNTQSFREQNYLGGTLSTNPKHRPIGCRILLASCHTPHVKALCPVLSMLFVSSIRRMVWCLVTQLIMELCDDSSSLVLWRYTNARRQIPCLTRRQ